MSSHSSSPSQQTGAATLARLAALYDTPVEQVRHIFQLLADGTRDLVCVHEPDGRYLWVSQTSEQLLGYTAEEMVGKDPYELFHPEDRTPIREGVHQKALGGTRDILSVRYRMRHKAGHYVWLETLTRTYHDADGVVAIQTRSRDITAQKRTEQALREEHHRLELALIGGELGLWDLDFRTGRNIVNARWAEMLGYTLEEVEQTQEFFNRHVHPDDLPRVYEAMERHARGETPYLEFELRMRTKDGDWRWILDRAKILEWEEDGRPKRAVGTHLDITERKETELALQRSEALLRKAQEIAQIGSWEVDLETGDVRWSDEMFRLLGRDPDDGPVRELDTLLQTHVHPDDRARLRQQRQQMIEIPYVLDGTYRLRREDGAERSVRAVTVPIPGDEGRPARFVGVMQDITESQKRDRQLLVLEAAISHANDAILITDADLEPPGPRIVFVNEAYEQMTGYSKQEVVGRRTLHLLNPDMDETTMQVMLAPLKRGDTLEEELRTQRKDGTPYWVRVHVAPVLDEAGQVTHCVSIRRDVTEQKQREAELVRAKEEAEAMSRLKTAFLANMSHEIRTPLTAIIGYADLLKHNDGAAQAGFAEMIELAGQRLMTTLTSVLDLAQLESGAFEVSLHPVDLQSEVRQAVRTYAVQANHDDLRLEAGDGGAVWAMGDERALTRILDNLLSNAIKFTERGHIHLRAYHDGDWAVLEVEDTGRGIDPAFLPHMFDEFRQETAGMRRSYEGTGLGLTIIKRLVDLMEGDVSARSILGEGTTFTVRLPRAEAS
ncbi:MAG: PAS domain-containing protein [Bacteroidetes bacterium]|jgi:PAS domain S-box-containing protein|nr:PAS domain-containing protein [Bacteroidota bacterium]